MNDSIIDSNWTKFATRVKGEIFSKPATSPGTSFYFDNIVQIKTGKEKIEFIWADQPEKGRGSFTTLKTIFSSLLPNNYSEILKIYRKDFLSSLLNAFNSRKIKIGDSVLDNEFIFFSSDTTLLIKILPSLKFFINQSKFTNIVVDIEPLDSEKFLTVQINELIVDEKELELFYKLGQDIRNSLNGA